MAIRSDLNDDFTILMEYSNNLSKEEIETIDAVKDDEYHEVLLSTNNLTYELDKKDNRNVSAIKNVKMAFHIIDGGCFILKGSLECGFREPYGGRFFVKGINVIREANFDALGGVYTSVKFSEYAIDSIESTQAKLMQLIEDPCFEFNLKQFDEFMDLFSYYKELSDKLNNNTTYNIKSLSRPFHFIPISDKNYEPDESEQLTNNDGVIVGYKIDNFKYDMMPSELKDEVQTLYNIVVETDNINKTIKNIKKFKDNLFISKYQNLSENTVKEAVDFDLVYLNTKDNQIILSGEVTRDIDDFKFLNLYDMGQKVKVESINNSLKLIREGATGAAAELLEYIIGDKPMPNNVNGRCISKAKEKYVEGLDPSQREAFLMATDGSPVSLIKGPPGTGKTYVINAIVQYIVKELGEKVVISSQTHVAIDNVLDKLMENYDLIIPNRITNRRNKYSGNEIDQTLYKTWGKNLVKHSKRSDNIELNEAVLNDLANFKGENKFCYSEETLESDFAVIGATTTTSAIGGKKGLELLNGYKWLIIDEVSKCPITEVLRYLPYVDKIIMVGDDFQLAPKLEFGKDDVKDFDCYNEDKFERLEKLYENSVFADTLNKAQKAHRLVTLNVNYRSVKNVLNAYNIFYDGNLINKREEVKPDKVKFKNAYNNLFNDKDIFFIDVQFGKEADSGTSRFNQEEIDATATVLQDIMVNVLNPSKVTVSAIFPYAAQIERFQKQNLKLINEAKKLFRSFEIDTVDAFQGRETDIVLVNTVVTDSTRRNFLNDFRRINVSMSRSRDKLFLFGNPSTLSKIEMKVSGGAKRTYFKSIIEDIRSKGAKLVYSGGMDYESQSKSKIKIN